MSDRYRSRKFWLAVAAALVSGVALFTGDLNGDQWVSVQAWVLGLYGAANLVNKKVT